MAVAGAGRVQRESGQRRGKELSPKEAGELLMGWFEDPGGKKVREWFADQLGSKRRGLDLPAKDLEHLFSRIEVGADRVALTLNPQLALPSGQERALAILLLELLARLRDTNIEKLGLTTGNFAIHATGGRSTKVLQKAVDDLVDWLEKPGAKVEKWFLAQLKSDRRGLALSCDDPRELLRDVRVGVGPSGERRILVALGTEHELSAESERELAILLLELVGRLRDKNIEKLGLTPADFSFEPASVELFDDSRYEA